MARTAIVKRALSQAEQNAQSQAERTREATQAAIDQDASAREAYASSGLPPDWLTSGLAGAGAGWVFGPGGALITAAATALFSKRRRQGIATQAQADAETASKLIEGGQRSIDRLRAAAETDQDLLEVDILEDQYRQAVTMARNPRGDIAAAGFEKLLGLPGLVQGEADEIEAAQLAREKLAREQHQQWVQNADDIRGDNQRESSRYVATLEAFDRMRRLYGQGTTVSDTSLIYALANLNDPGAIVTDGDISALASTGSISEQALALYQQVLKGEGKLTDTQRAELFNAGKAIMQSQMQMQLERNDLAVDRARTNGLPVEFQRQVVVPVPDSLREAMIPTPVGPPPRAPVGTDEQGQPRQTRTEQPGFVSRGVAGIGMFATEVGADLARMAQGQSIQVDPTTGERFVVDESGGIVEQLDPERQFENLNGDTIERVETPNGPVFRNLSQLEDFDTTRRGRNAAARARRRGGTLRPVNE